MTADSQNRSVIAAALVFAGYTALMLVPERDMKSTGGPGMIPFELAGTEARAVEIMDGWGERGRRAARTSLRLDFGYAASYGVPTALLLVGPALPHRPSSAFLPLPWGTWAYAVWASGPQDELSGVLAGEQL